MGTIINGKDKPLPFGPGMGIEDCVLDMSSLDQKTDPLSIDGREVCLYGVFQRNENVYDHRIGGNAFLSPIDGAVMCRHR